MPRTDRRTRAITPRTPPTIAPTGVVLLEWPGELTPVEVEVAAPAVIQKSDIDNVEAELDPPELVEDTVPKYAVLPPSIMR